MPFACLQTNVRIFVSIPNFAFLFIPSICTSGHQARRLRMAAAAERERERAERVAELAAAAAAFEPLSVATAEAKDGSAATAAAAIPAQEVATVVEDNPADDSQDDALYPPLSPFLRLELCDLPADCVDEALMLKLLASLQAPPGCPSSDATPLQVCNRH